MKTDYSDAERRLFRVFDFEYLCEYRNIAPVMIYRNCVEVAFLKVMAGPAVDALRRGYGALQECAIYRMTPEFDALISFE